MVSLRDRLLSSAAGWRHEYPLLRASSDAAALNRDAFRAAGGTRQRERSLEPTESGYYDLPRYRCLLQEVGGGFGPDALAVDLGCGDGRASRLLLDLGWRAIVSLDFDDGSLLRLWDSLSAAERERVVPVCASFDDPPVVAGAADLAVLLEVVSTLPDPAVAFSTIAAMLRPGGRAVVTDPAMDALFVHALLNANWSLLEQLSSAGVYEDVVGGYPVKLYPRGPDEVSEVARTCGLTVAVHRSFPARAALLLHGLKLGGMVRAHLQLARSIDELESVEIPRLHVWVLEKDD